MATLKHRVFVSYSNRDRGANDTGRTMGTKRMRAS